MRAAFRRDLLRRRCQAHTSRGARQAPLAPARRRRSGPARSRLRATQGACREGRGRQGARCGPVPATPQARLPARHRQVETKAMRRTHPDRHLRRRAPPLRASSLEQPTAACRSRSRGTVPRSGKGRKKRVEPRMNSGRPMPRSTGRSRPHALHDGLLPSRRLPACRCRPRLRPAVRPEPARATSCRPIRARADAPCRPASRWPRAAAARGRWHRARAG